MCFTHILLILYSNTPHPLKSSFISTLSQPLSEFYLIYRETLKSEQLIYFHVPQTLIKHNQLPSQFPTFSSNKTGTKLHHSAPANSMGRMRRTPEGVVEFSHTLQFFSVFQEATAFDPPDYPREMSEEFNFEYDTKGLPGSIPVGNRWCDGSSSIGALNTNEESSQRSECTLHK